MEHVTYIYPAYARAERIADFAVHSMGLALGIVGTPLLVVFAALHLEGDQVAALAIYGAALTFSFAASLLYHFPPREAIRPIFRRLDHAAIYLKIAGTYTPLAVLLGTAFSYVILGVVWALAIAGAVAKLLRQPGDGSGVALYLILGWLSLTLVWPLAQVAPVATMVLIVAGGLLYTLGIVFFLWEKLRFAQAIWHAFVVSASACFFTAITLGAFLVT